MTKNTKRKSFNPSHLKFIAAPLVNQSDLPWRMLVAKYGATCTYTQMYKATDLNSDPQLLQSLKQDLLLARLAPENKHQIPIDLDHKGKRRQETFDDQVEEIFVSPHKPQIVQLAGNDPQELLKASEKLIGFADGIDLNLGCPQRRAREGHYGAYLLAKKDWPLLEEIVTLLTTSLPIPVSVKIRLCSPIKDTIELSLLLARCGISHLTLHARFTSEINRRKGPANLEMVGELVRAFERQGLSRVKIVSNGNVRGFEDVEKNLKFTDADGVMCGERLLEDACLFLPFLSPELRPQIYPSPLDQSLEYLDLITSPHLNHGLNPLRSPTPSIAHIKQHLKSMLSVTELYPPSKERTLLIKNLENDRREEEQVERSGSDFNMGFEERKREIERLKLVLEEEVEIWKRWKKEREGSGSR